MSTFDRWRAERARPGRSTWREFLSSPEGRTIVVTGVLRLASSTLPAIAVQRVWWAVTGYGSHSGWVEFVLWAFGTALGVYTYFRIDRWHDHQDQLELERSRQEN